MCRMRWVSIVDVPTMVEHLIYQSAHSQVYVLPESQWGMSVVRKMLNNEHPSPNDLTRFYNEFDILSSLEISGTRKVLDKARHKHHHALYFEYVEGETLANAFQQKPVALPNFLELGCALARVLGELHKHNIIHKDISSHNILFNSSSRKVTLIDFGISTRIKLKQQHLGNPERLEGNLDYISPEQTGRMNRSVDYRSDLYSMGVVFYELLTGSLPFKATDAMGLVHAHIALSPEPVSSRRPEIPVVVSDIVDRLLTKNAEDRYQSAAGVEHDLARCLDQYRRTGTVSPFELASNDFSGQFQIPQKLYGRENEQNVLMQAFKQVSQGATKLVTVAGYSGTGKSALVHEVHKPVTEKHAYFIQGKFDQFQRSVPYIAILQAFREYVDLILTESDEHQSRIRQSLQDALGAEGKVLTDVLPNLTHIIGQQPDVVDVMGSEAQNRFNYLFVKFVAAISSAEHPIVLFIDDLQWADSASIHLLKILMNDRSIGYLLCIGAYRDNEVNDSHPFIMALSEMREQGVDLVPIKIGNLKRSDVHQLVADSVSSSLENTHDLAELIYSKTSGNAFFTQQFLKSLYQDNHLYFDFDNRVWVWNADDIRALDITDNVVELMAGKLRKLPSSTLEVLKLAACIGHTFDPETIAIIQQSDLESVRNNLYTNLSEGLIFPSGEQFRFAHDRIQQAVYSLIATQARSELHLEIGRLLLANTSKENVTDRLFDIVNQWNLGEVASLDSSERLTLAGLNYDAGFKAKQSSAFVPALEYLEQGISLLPDMPWQNQYELTRNLYTATAETAYLNGNFSRMEECVDDLLNNVNELSEKVVPYEIRILAYKAENRLLEAINTGIDVLAHLGEKFPAKPTMAHVMADLALTKSQLAGKSTEYLANLPDMTDQDKIACMRIIADIASCSYWATPNLFPLLIMRMCRLSLKYGNTALSAFGFGAYGVIMCGVLGAMRSGHEYGKLSLILLDRFDARGWLAQIYTPIYALIINWNEHIEKTLSPLRESYHIGLETGAVEFACINANIYCIHAYLSGRPLEPLEAETKAFSDSFEQYKQETNANYNEVYHQGMLNFMGKSDDPLILTGTAYDEEQMVRQNHDRNDQTGTFFIHFNKLILCYHFMQYDEAKYHATESRKLLDAVLAKFEIPNHHYYEALTLLALYSKSSPNEKRRIMRRVRNTLRKLRKWSVTAPENYQHKYHLVNAERLRVLGKANNKAGLEYDRAIEGASNNRYLHEEGLSYELAGRHYMAMNSDRLAHFNFQAAYAAYQQWGAVAKLNLLEQHYPEFVSQSMGSVIAPYSSLPHGGTSAMVDRSSLDLFTVLKASTAISGEIKLRSLLEKMMKMVVENAGAQFGYLLLSKGSQLLVQAEYDANTDATEVLQGAAPGKQHRIALSIIQYVSKTGDNVVVNDATVDDRFVSDAHLKANNPKSILCTTIVNQGRFVGLMYLEHVDSPGAFTQDRIDILNLLSGQIAISIDNAVLYENLESKVQERTRELNEEKQKSDNLLLNILPVETANELRLKGRASPRRYESVTVMFTDFKDFTRISEMLTTEELVNEIDTCFAAFDDIMEKHGVEKIKTIGDAYMCVGGLPVTNSTHPEDTASAALDIQSWISQRKTERERQGLPGFGIRIGLHTGPIVAGVVGTRKYAYDVWGETVNTAARMESGSEAGKINISGSTYEQLHDRFVCDYRGKLPAKNMNDIEMYFLTGRE